MPPKKKIKRKRLVFTRKHINKDLSVTRIPVKFFPVNIPHVSTENVCDRTAPSTSRTPSMDHVAAEVRIEKSPSAAETEPTKKEEEVRAWQNIRRNVQTAYIESSVPSCTCCQVCSQPSPEVLVICFDCDTRPVMCPGCAVEKHALNTKFHNLVQYKVYYYICLTSESVPYVYRLYGAVGKGFRNYDRIGGPLDVYDVLMHVSFDVYSLSKQRKHM